MSFTYGDIARLKWELGYNAVGIGAEAYVLNSYVAVFDAIVPYISDQGSTSSTTVTAQSTPTNTTLTLAANPPVTGAQMNVYGNVFSVGAKISVDVGPAQETNVIVQAISGLNITVALQNAHGAAGSYPVTLQGVEFLARDILARLDILNGQIKGFAPVVAGIAEGDNDAKFFAGTRGGRRGSQRGVIDDLIEQRDWARKDLAALLGIQNLWDLRGRFGSSEGGSGSYAAF